MSPKRRLHLGAFMRPVSIHTAWWRYPGSAPDANFNLKHLVSFAQTLEHGRFDAFFMADHLAVLNMPMDALKRSATVTSFDPDAPLPDLPESNQSKSGRERAIALGQRENLTVRQLAQRFGGYSGNSVVGTAQTIADEMEAWFEAKACAG